ncbi:MAG: hypothetical protein ACR2NP_15375, partial [Pirellulaceae bacterium]
MMDVLLLLFGLVLFVAFLAIYGFVTLVTKLFAPPKSTPLQPISFQGARPEGALKDDVVGSARLLNY